MTINYALHRFSAAGPPSDVERPLLGLSYQTPHTGRGGGGG